MSYNKITLNYRVIKTPLIDYEKQSKELSSEELRNYDLMNNDILKSRAYILAKRYQLSSDDTEEALNLFGNYSKTLYFTEIVLNELKIDRINYLSALKTIKEDGLDSLKRQPVSLLEQEIMNFQNKFNLDPNERELALLEREGVVKHIKEKTYEIFLSKRNNKPILTGDGKTKRVNIKEIIFNQFQLYNQNLPEFSAEYYEHLDSRLDRLSE